MTYGIDADGKRQFGRRLKAQRILSGRSVEEVAEELGISPQSWYAYELGRSVFVATMIPRIERALRMAPGKLAERLLYPDTDRMEPQRFERGDAARTDPVDSAPMLARV